MDYLDLLDDLDVPIAADGCRSESTDVVALVNVPVARESHERAPKIDDGRLIQVFGERDGFVMARALRLFSRGSSDQRKQWSLRLHLAKARKKRYLW